MYGVMLRDYYIFFANSSGVICGVFCIVSTLGIIAKSKEGFEAFQYKCLECMLMGGVVFYLILAMTIGISMSDAGEKVKETVVAFTANTFCVLYYGAPCSTMIHIVLSKDSSSLYLPMILANLLNALLWSVYGFFALRDMFVVIPNAIGLGLAVIQLCLIVVYSKTLVNDAENETSVAYNMLADSDTDNDV